MVSSGHDRPATNANRERRPTESVSGPGIHRPTVRRFPLFVVALSLAAGIIAGRYAPFSPVGYGALSLVGCGIWGVARRKNHARLAWCGLAVGFCSVGALHHQVAVMEPARAGLRPLFEDDFQLARLRGEIVNAPELFPAPAPRWDGERPQDDLTRFDLRCSALFDDGDWRPVTGSLQVDVSGWLDSVSAGDRVEVSGWGGELPRRRNPGQRDVRADLLSRGLCGVLRVESPALVAVQYPNNSLRSRVRRYLRAEFDRTLQAGVRPQTLPVAQAMLLGDRSLLSSDLRSVFVESGTMHLLAISGLHVGIVALFLYGVARGLRCPPRIATLIMLAILTLYIDAADSRPPMIRAFILIIIWSVSRLLNRPAFSGNSLSAAALVLLAINPATLFDVGAQLSFLAVATIMWCVALGRRRDDGRRVDVAVAPDSPRARDALRPVWQRWLFTGARNLRRPLAVSGAIWGVSAPLAAATFNIVAPIGIVLNVILIPLVGIGLCFGFLGMLVGIVNVDAAAAPLTAFDALITLVMWIAEAASQMKAGHLPVPRLPMWWLLCFYLVVALAMTGTIRRRKPAWLWATVVLWLMFGFVLPNSYARTRSAELTCTFLSTGHGLSIVVETPNDRVLVYDCGAAGRPQAAAVTLQRFLLDRGITEVDGLLVSHSDADHFNGIELLPEYLAINQLLISRHFPDAEQQGTLSLINTADQRSIPITIVERGDRLQIDPAVALTILHPSAGDEFDSDNEASVVLQIEFAGRRILLTGDLEESGLQSLLRQPGREIDVLLAPHHGALAASPPEVVAWARPRFVVASARRRFDPQALADRYGPNSRVLTTSHSGAIEFRISPTGHLTVREFLAETSQADR